jgi:hypothetical protein
MLMMLVRQISKTKASARELIDAVEAQGFEGEAGPLENSTQWVELKRRLTQPRATP